MNWIGLLLSAAAFAPSEPPPQRFDFRLSRTIETTPLLAIIHGNADESITDAPLGVRVTPPVRGRAQDQSGYLTKFQPGGDFEVTAGYVLVSGAKPPPTSGAG